MTQTIHLEVQKWCESNSSFYFKTNANDAMTVEKTFTEIIRVVFSRRDETDDGTE